MIPLNTKEQEQLGGLRAETHGTPVLDRITWLLDGNRTSLSQVEIERLQIEVCYRKLVHEFRMPELAERVRSEYNRLGGNLPAQEAKPE